MQQAPAGAPIERRSNVVGTARSNRGLPRVVALFLIGLIIPLNLYIGPLRLSPYRLVLLVMLIPCLLAWAGGRAGPRRIADFCVIGICIWSAISLIVVHGLEFAVEPSGMTTIETAGAYFLGRSYIRTPEAFRGMVRLLFILVLVMLPTAIVETVTARDVVVEWFGKIGASFPDVWRPPRWGLDRVQGPFEHPILFGVFCGSSAGLSLYVLGYGQRFIVALWRPFALFATALLSLSSGPVTAVTTQIFLITWDRVLRNYRRRWQLLAWIFASMFIAVDMISNRTPFKVFASYLAFNAATAYDRIFIWEWGTRSIFKHPIFGIGYNNDWERLEWMSESVDMFWILPAMQHGIPVWIMYFTLFFSITIKIGRRRGLDSLHRAYRAGYLISMSGLFVCGWAVHFWNATFVLLLFLLGSGVWLIDAPADDTDGRQVPPPAKERKPRTVLSG